MITRETDYAFRILRALSNGKKSTAAEICRQELLPKQFVYKILKKLARASLIQISRGAEGGCKLNVDLKTVSFYDMTCVMGENRDLSACMHPGYQCAWKQKKEAVCHVHCQLSKIQASIDKELRSYSLHQMIFGNDDTPTTSPSGNT